MPIAEARLKYHERVRVFVGLLLTAALLLVLSGCAVPVIPNGQERGRQLTAAEQQTLGRQAYQQIVQQSGGIYPDRELAAHVARIGQSLAAASRDGGSDYRFAVLNDSAPKALSLPGGFVAVSRGLLLTLQTEAQLAAVLAGEIGHLAARHQLPLAAPAALRADLSAAGDYAVLLTGLAQLQSGLSEPRYSLVQELEADRLAIDLMVAAGFAPTAVGEVQELLLDHLERFGENGGSDRLPDGHLLSAERLKQTRTYLAERYPGTGGRTDAGEFPLPVKQPRQVAEGYALYEQARRLERQGQLAAAIETYHQALQSAPEQALILTGLGLAYLRNEDPVPARRYLLKAVNLDGDYAQSRLGLGYVYLQKWQYAQAISQLEQSLRLLPTVEAAFLLAEAQQKVGHKGKARDLYLIVAAADRDGKLGQLAATRLEQLKGD
jgi:predicted Zn-dependent protease